MEVSRDSFWKVLTSNGGYDNFRFPRVTTSGELDDAENNYSMEFRIAHATNIMNQITVTRLDDEHPFIIHLTPFNLDEVWVILGDEILGAVKTKEGDFLRVFCDGGLCYMEYCDIKFLVCEGKPRTNNTPWIHAYQQLYTDNINYENRVLTNTMAFETIDSFPTPKVGEVTQLRVWIDGRMCGTIIVRGLDGDVTQWFAHCDKFSICCGCGRLSESDGTIQMVRINGAIVVKNANRWVVVWCFFTNGHLHIELVKD